MRNPSSLFQDYVNLSVSHCSPPFYLFRSPIALIVSLNFLYALCTFCFTDPTLEDVALATSSKDIPATFSISITSRWLSASALLGTGSAVLLGVFAMLFHDYHTDHFISVGIVCLTTGVLHAIPVVLLSWLVLRRGFAVNSVSAGLAAGTLAGLAGVGLLELHCPNFQATHILVWHTMVVPLSGALGALVGWALRFRVKDMRRAS